MSVLLCINACCFVISWFNNMTHHYRYVSHYFIGSLIMTIAFSNEVNLGTCNFHSAKVLIRVTAKVWIPYFLYYASKVICQYLYMVRLVLWFVFLLSKVKIRSYEMYHVFSPVILALKFFPYILTSSLFWKLRYIHILAAAKNVCFVSVLVCFYWPTCCSCYTLTMIIYIVYRVMFGAAYRGENLLPHTHYRSNVLFKQIN